jgi:hypothetical protein
MLFETGAIPDFEAGRAAEEENFASVLAQERGRRFRKPNPAFAVGAQETQNRKTFRRSFGLPRSMAGPGRLVIFRVRFGAPAAKGFDFGFHDSFQAIAPRGDGQPNGSEGLAKTPGEPDAASRVESPGESTPQGLHRKPPSAHPSATISSII